MAPSTRTWISQVSTSRLLGWGKARNLIGNDEDGQSELAKGHAPARREWRLSLASGMLR